MKLSGLGRNMRSTECHSS